MRVFSVPVTAALFDFDGTLSTLRRGWETVMEPLMTELLGEDSRDTVRAYIGESAGLQTIRQMQWLAGQVRRRRGEARDPWEYKAEYNRRLMETVSRRRAALAVGTAERGDYLIAGAEALLQALSDRGIALYVASGTDDADVRAEAEALGLAGYFQTIAGAPPGAEDCPKERVIRELLRGASAGDRLAVVGDGRVEIAAGRENGARTLGVASDEEARRGINPVKEKRLVKAGADRITGDYLALDSLLRFFTGE